VLGERAGLGLGFFIAKTLLERSGAEVSLQNRVKPATGAIVRIVWPRAAYETTNQVFGRERGTAAASGTAAEKSVSRS
jgi:two-component system sensor histidine kinase RegB